MNAKKAKRLRQAIGYRDLKNHPSNALQNPQTIQQFPMLTQGGSVVVIECAVPSTATHRKRSVRKLYKTLKNST